MTTPTPADYDGVVVAVEVGDDGLVLVHPAGDRRGPASLPAGSCRPGEEPAAGAVRLVREQTGLDVRVEAELVTFVQAGTPSGTMLAHGLRAVPVGGTLLETGTSGPVGVYPVTDLPPAVAVRVAVRRVLAEYLLSRGGVPEGVRLRVDLAYDGSGFSGWAAQPGRRTVEGVLSDALTTVLRAPEPVRLTVAGRTDAGVHARGQVAHADVDAAAVAALPGRSDRRPEAAAVVRLQGVLPDDVVVHRVSVAPPGFDARFSALRRCYRYRVLDDPSALDPLRRHDTVVVRDRLDVDAMTVAAERLVGLHDFAAFCKRREGATTVRTLLEYRWARAADGVLEGTVVADAFCHSMVRALVGAVVPVGEGRMPPEWPADVLTAGVRDPRVKVMPAHGLSLEEVVYPPDDELAARADQARASRALPG